MASYRLLQQGASLLFLDFFKKDFCFVYIFLYFSQLILLFTWVSICQYFIFLFLYWVWLILSFLFHIFELLWNLKFMKVKSQTYHGVCYLMHQVIKRYRNVSLHVSKWTQCYISFWTLLISIDITGVAWSNFSGSYEGFVGHEIMSLHRHKSH